MRMLCARVKTRLRAVSESEYALTLGQLVAGEAAADKSENNADVEIESFSDEMLVKSPGFRARSSICFCRTSSASIYRQFRSRPCLRPQIQSGHPVQLHKELCAEREAFARGMSAHESK